MSMKKRYLSANELLQQSFQLAELVWADGYRPDALIGLWRGGAPVAVAVHEYLAWKGHSAMHFPLAVQSYAGIDKRQQPSIFGLEGLLPQLKPCAHLLLVDDVVDSGHTLSSLIHVLAELAPWLEVRMAAPWFKPDCLQVPVRPDYWLHETRDWLVFPHELQGLSELEYAEKQEIWSQGSMPLKLPR